MRERNSEPIPFPCHGGITPNSSMQYSVPLHQCLILPSEIAISSFLSNSPKEREFLFPISSQRYCFNCPSSQTSFHGSPENICKNADRIFERCLFVIRINFKFFESNVIQTSGCRSVVLLFQQLDKFSRETRHFNVQKLVTFRMFYNVL